MTRPTSVQTGQPKGTYKLGDKHPSLPDRFFKQYGRCKDNCFREVWVTNNGMKAVLDTSRNKKWRDANPDNQNLPSRVAYRAARSRQIHKAYSALPDTHKGIVSGIYEASQRVSKCLGVTFHVDHVVPISKGGQHTPDNLQIVPAKWNLQKSNKNTARWA